MLVGGRSRAWWRKNIQVRNEFQEQLWEERRRARMVAGKFVRACQTGDCDAFYDAVDEIAEWTVGGWTVAMRKAARDLKEPVSPEIQSAFLVVWIKYKMLPLKVGDHRALCTALRLLLPPYRGPAVRLYRGASAGERRRRIYGVSWTIDKEVADRFAQDYRTWDDGSVLLETIAPPQAVLCSVDEAGGYYEESEYILDRRHLSGVKVVARYSQPDDARAITSQFKKSASD